MTVSPRGRRMLGEDPRGETPVESLVKSLLEWLVESLVESLEPTRVDGR